MNLNTIRTRRTRQNTLTKARMICTRQDELGSAEDLVEIAASIEALIEQGICDQPFEGAEEQLEAFVARLDGNAREFWDNEDMTVIIVAIKGDRDYALALEVNPEWASLYPLRENMPYNAVILLAQD